MKTAYLLAVLVATAVGTETTSAETIVCSNLTGMRVDRFSSNQTLVKARKRGQAEWSKDAITGLVGIHAKIMVADCR